MRLVRNIFISLNMANNDTDSSSSSSESGSVISSSNSPSSSDSSPSAKESSAKKGFDSTENGNDYNSQSLALLQEKNASKTSEDSSPEKVNVKKCEKREENNEVRLTNRSDLASPEKTEVLSDSNIAKKCESTKNKAPGELEEGELSNHEANTRIVDDKEKGSEGMKESNGQTVITVTGDKSIENIVDVSEKSCKKDQHTNSNIANKSEKSNKIEKTKDLRSISKSRQRSRSRSRSREQAKSFRRSRSRNRSISRQRSRSRSRKRSRRSVSLERRQAERKRRHARRERFENEDRNKKRERGKSLSAEDSPKRNKMSPTRKEKSSKNNDENDNATVTDPKAKITERQRRTVEMLTSRTGGAYIPPAKLRMMQAEITDKASAAYQRIAWEALKKSIHGYINKVNVDNIAIITRELLKENIVRGRGLLCRSIIQAQAASPTFTHVYAALVSIINSKFPNIGELLLKRLVIQFKRAFRRNDKAVCLSSSRFVAHLVNQRVAHEILALEILTLLVETPTDDSVEVAIAFLKECGMKLTEVSSKGIGAIFEMLKNILHEGKLDKRVQYMIEVVFQVRKDGFKDHQSIIESLELVEEDDQFTHLLMLDEATNPEDILNAFKFDDQYENNEEKYKGLCKEILGSDASSGESDSGSNSDSESGSGASSDSENEGEDGGQKTAVDIIDNTETNLIALRRTIYLTINSSLDYEECAHKLMKMQLKPGQEIELCHMFLDCCAEQRTYEKFYGLLAQRFCSINKIYIEPFEEIFKDTYQTTHRLDTNRLRNVSKFFAHLLFTDAIGWDVLECIKLNEDDTTSSSRIFIKILFQELAEYMGLGKLNTKLKDEVLSESLAGLFPKDNPRNTRFAINFFTSIGLGGLTDELRQFLKNAPKSVPAINVEILAVKPEESSSISSSLSSSSSSESSSSSSETTDSGDSEDEKRQKKKRSKAKTNSKKSNSRDSKREKMERKVNSRKNKTKKTSYSDSSSDSDGSSDSKSSASDDGSSSSSDDNKRKRNRESSSKKSKDSSTKSKKKSSTTKDYKLDRKQRNERYDDEENKRSSKAKRDKQDNLQRNQRNDDEKSKHDDRYSDKHMEHRRRRDKSPAHRKQEDKEQISERKERAKEHARYSDEERRKDRESRRQRSRSRSRSRSRNRNRKDRSYYGKRAVRSTRNGSKERG